MLSRYPDVRALTYNRKTGMLTVIYSDRSIYTWQETGRSILKISSQLFHVGPVISLEASPADSFLAFFNAFKKNDRSFTGLSTKF